MIRDLENFKAVLLSPKHYENRRGRFFTSLEESGGFLKGVGVEWFEATPHWETFAPTGYWWRHVHKRRHYWAATQDHLTILETAILEGVENLLILEDDARFSDDFSDRFGKTVELLPSGWRGLQLNWNSDSADRTTDIGLQAGAGYGAGMLANLWSREGMIRLHSHAWSRRNRIIDNSYDHLRQIEPALFFRPSYPLFFQDTADPGKGYAD